MTNPSRNPCAHHNGTLHQPSPALALAGIHAAAAAPRAADLPTWMDTALPWSSSTLLHMAIALIVLFLVLVVRSRIPDDPADFTLPTIPASPFAAEDNPAGRNGGVRHPGPGENHNLDAFQNLKQVMDTKGWARVEGDPKNASFLAGAGSPDLLSAIVRGSGAKPGGSGADGTGRGEGGPLAPYGSPNNGGGGIGPKSNFYGLGGDTDTAHATTRIVYLLDHSGSLLDNFNFLQKELKRSTSNLLPFQSFGVVVFAGTEEGTEILTPGNSLVRASAANTRAAGLRMDTVVAKGRNDDELLPFLDAFQKAFAMHPQVIYFLTDGRFDPRLIDEVAKLNQNKAVRINTIAFVRQENDYFDQMRAISRQSGGTFKFVSEREVAGPAQ